MTSVPQSDSPVSFSLRLSGRNHRLILAPEGLLPKPLGTTQQQISVTTNGHGDMHDITDHIASVVGGSGVTIGIVNVFNVGSTAAIGTIEFEPGLRADMPAILDKLMPPSRNYGHEQAWHDGNGHSHLQASLLGPSLTVPIADGKLVLGTWQQIFHLECDVRGRQRTVVVTVIGQ